MGSVTSAMAPSRAKVKLHGTVTASIAVEDLKRNPWFEARLQRWEKDVCDELSNSPEVDIDCAGVGDPKVLLLVASMWPQIYPTSKALNSICKLDLPPDMLTGFLALTDFLLIEFPPESFITYLKQQDLDKDFEALLLTPMKDGRHACYLQAAVHVFFDTARKELSSSDNELPHLLPLKCQVARRISELIAKPPFPILPGPLEALGKLKELMLAASKNSQLKTQLSCLEQYANNGPALDLIAAAKMQVDERRQYASLLNTPLYNRCRTQPYTLQELNTIDLPLLKCRLSSTGAMLRRLPKDALENTRLHALANIEGDAWSHEWAPQFQDLQPPFGLFDGDPDVLQTFPMLRKFPWQCGNVMVVLGGGAMTHCFTRQGHGDLDFYFCRRPAGVFRSCICDLGLALRNCIEHLIAATCAPYSIVVKNPRTVSLLTKSPKMHFQFIMSLFNSVDEILLLADVACTQIMFDGKDIHLSPRALVSLLTGYIDVCNSYQTPYRMCVDFPRRLVKYTSRGFGIVRKCTTLETLPLIELDYAVKEDDADDAGPLRPDEPQGWKLMRLLLEGQQIAQPQKKLGEISLYDKEQLIQRRPSQRVGSIQCGSFEEVHTDHRVAPWLDEVLLVEVEHLPNRAGICGKEMRRENGCAIFDVSSCNSWQEMCITDGRFFAIPHNCTGHAPVHEQDAVFQRIWDMQSERAARMQRQLCLLGIPLEKARWALVQSLWHSMDQAVDALCAIQVDAELYFTSKFTEVFLRSSVCKFSGVIFEHVQVGEQVSRIQANTIGAMVDHFVEAGLLSRSAVDSSIVQNSAEAQQEIPVVILDYSRNPQPFLDTLRTCTELEHCRSALASNGYNSELECGVHVFVQPEYYEAVMTHVRLQRHDLCKRHVVVTPEFENIVEGVIGNLPGSLRIRVKGREVSSVAQGISPGGTTLDGQNVESISKDGQSDTEQNCVEEQHCPIDRRDMKDRPKSNLETHVMRTFISVPIASSLYSNPPSEAAKTA